jgi:hypothetical protein
MRMNTREFRTCEGTMISLLMMKVMAIEITVVRFGNRMTRRMMEMAAEKRKLTRRESSM